MSDPRIISIPNHDLMSGTVRIAVASLATDDLDWDGAVEQNPSLDQARYNRLVTLIRGVLTHRPRPHYLILPELCMPLSWGNEFAKWLVQNRISLIIGLEYHHFSGSQPRMVANSVMYYLVMDCGNGRKRMKKIQQDKVCVAHKEGMELDRIGGLQLGPQLHFGEKTIIKHGDFNFASLICSEFSNIEYRTALSGKVDSLFVLEWNKDINAFNSLVESNAMDLHAYIVQVNNRKYGDSRIRGPFKEDYDRDIVRLKGGSHDYFVVGEINYQKLREFQSERISPENPFKPIPDGFRPFEERRTFDLR